MSKQRVYLGVTQSNRPGWFTNGFLVFEIKADEYYRLCDDQVAAKKEAERLGFEYEEQIDGRLHFR